MKEITSTKCKIYRVNPSCPNCGEEHAYYDIMLSEEEQNTLDNYNTNEIEIRYQLRIEKNFMCPICKMEFSKSMGIYRENAIDYKSDDYIP